MAERKRTREEDQTDGEFFPLSKRITQLRIHSELTQIPPSPKMCTEYQPDLNAMENPHYYDANKLLYELHMSKNSHMTKHSHNQSTQ